MDEQDFETFERGFRRLVRVFRLRLTEPDLKELMQTYFRILRDVQVDRVLDAARVWVTTKTTFPKPAEWLHALAKPKPTGPVPPGVRVMDVEEAAEWSRAERLCWEDAPCGCVRCHRAGIERPIRFVPQDTLEGGDEQAIHPVKSQPVTAGYWAHGDELARWYAARERFYALAKSHGRQRIVALIGAEREPGEEG